MKGQVWASSLLLAAFGCSEFNISGKDPTVAEPFPVIEVTPLKLTFPMLSTGEEEQQRFTVANIGDAPLTLEDIQITQGISFTVLGSFAGQVLDPGARTEVDVVFSPLEAYQNLGIASVVSDDPVTPVVEVELVGEGAVPQLELDPPSYDFGTGEIPCPEEVAVTFRNVGQETLEVRGVAFEGEQMTLPADIELPFTLEPGAERAVTVVYSPEEIGSAWGELTVDSNDPRGLQTADQRGDSNFPAFNVDGFEVPDNPPVDILFAVDQSCSMEPDQRRLADNFDAFIRQIDTVTSGWQIGVVTKDSGCFNQGILTASTPDYIGKFSSAVSAGGLFDTTLTEKLLQLSNKAVQNSAPGDCNAGFLRPGALLHVIVVSDEREQSNDPLSYVTSMQDAVGAPSLLKISGVVDEDGSCGDQGADNGAAGYLPAIAETGGLILDICNDGWGDQVEDLALASLEGLGEYVLSDWPQEDTLEVYIDGVLQSGGWSYDPGRNSIIIDTELEGGEFIEVRYGALAECP